MTKELSSDLFVSNSHSQPISTGWTFPVAFGKPRAHYKPLKQLVAFFPGLSAIRLKPDVNMRRISIPLVMLSLLMPACGKGDIKPIAIEENDMCSFCKMTISEKRYAAELIDSDRQAFKFDDIGCMTDFINQKRNGAPIRARFVMEFNRREWLKAETAFYVRSSEFKTPMNGGIVAFKDEASAREAAAKYHGTLLRFDEVNK